MKTYPNTLPDGATRMRLAVRGAVQGVGFRPFVYRLAVKLRLCGWVNNGPQGVVIEIEGARESMHEFLSCLKAEKPANSWIQSVETTWLDWFGYDGFEIRSSATVGEKTALVLPDIATCPDCLGEILDPTNRRYRYPFTNCTNCGPRFSIIESLPYDRANTSMKKFAMCPMCQAEYEDPRSRRFHAQPNACPVCGPRLELWNAEGENMSVAGEALLAAANAIRRGEIIAVKGLGGFHLILDARNESAVEDLRRRKGREEKPFALQFPSIESVKAFCEVSLLEERLLRSPEAPIVLLRKIRMGEPLIANSVAPGNPNLGVMLPSNPLHHLLMKELDFPVVATSCNMSDEPICTDEFEALKRLHGIADAFLVHDRPILRHVDDSIVRVIMDREMVLRRARGYAPLPVQLRMDGCNKRSILALGAHLKNSVSLAVGEQVFLSQHIGDLETEPANNAFRRVVEELPRLYDEKPEIVVSDLHPGYLSTQYADELGRAGLPRGQDLRQRVPVIARVQHHIAHALSCIAENEVELPALGVAWDGTGLGTDGTIWGGEFFLITGADVKRVAHLRQFRLPGGEAAAKEPRRAAFGILQEVYGEKVGGSKELATIAAFSHLELSTLRTMLERRINSPQCTSMGRLFDAVASLTGIRQIMRFEGQAAMELEFALDGCGTDETYRFPLIGKETSLVLDWSSMIGAIVFDTKRGLSVGEISAKFHNTLAESIGAVAEHFDQTRVALSGGCFQNRYLTERTVKRLRKDGFQPYWPRRVPTNDGGIALGQVVAARRELLVAAASCAVRTPQRGVPAFA